MRRVVLVSGGIDSTICADLYPEAALVFVDFGQAESARELRVVRRLFPARMIHEVRIEASFTKAENGVYVPARNLLLASIAVHYGDEIILGALRDDHCEDKTPEAMRAMSRVLTDFSRKEVLVTSPLIARAKWEAVADHLARGFSGDRLRSTWSCYGSREERCLDCPACLRWSVALLVNGILVELPGDRVILDYLARLGSYEEDRQWSLLKALQIDARRSLLLCDIDGVIALGEGRDYARKQLDSATAHSLARLHEEGRTWIILHTARPEYDRATTERWLAEQRVSYHGLLMNKPSAHFIVDDAPMLRRVPRAD